MIDPPIEIEFKAPRPSSTFATPTKGNFVGPKVKLAQVRSDVGNEENTGLVVLILSFVDPDP